MQVGRPIEGLGLHILSFNHHFLLFPSFASDARTEMYRPWAKCFLCSKAYHVLAYSPMRNY